jgi:hypothetical protein
MTNNDTPSLPMMKNLCRDIEGAPACPIGIECLSTEMLVHVLECGAGIDCGRTYSFMWRTTTAFLLTSKQMANAVCVWRSTVHTLNFLPEFCTIFDKTPCVTRRDQAKYLAFHASIVKVLKASGESDIENKRCTQVQSVFFYHVIKTIVKRFSHVDTLCLSYEHDDLDSVLSLTPLLKTLDVTNMSYCFLDQHIPTVCLYLPHLTSLIISSNASVNNHSVALLSKKYEGKLTLERQAPTS